MSAERATFAALFSGRPLEGLKWRNAKTGPKTMHFRGTFQSAPRQSPEVAKRQNRRETEALSRHFSAGAPESASSGETPKTARNRGTFAALFSGRPARAPKWRNPENAPKTRHFRAVFLSAKRGTFAPFSETGPKPAHFRAVSENAPKTGHFRAGFRGQNARLSRHFSAGAPESARSGETPKTARNRCTFAALFGGRSPGGLKWRNRKTGPKTSHFRGVFRKRPQTGALFARFSERARNRAVFG